MIIFRGEMELMLSSQTNIATASASYKALREENLQSRADTNRKQVRIA